MATYISARNIVANESDGFVDIVVTLSAASATPVAVNYSMSYDTAQFNDFTSLSGTLNFAANETSKTLRLTLTNDTAAEGHESMYLRLSNPTNAVIATTNTIITIAANDQAPGVPLASLRDVVVDEGAGTAVFTVVLDKPATGIVTLAYSTSALNATSGADFGIGNGTLIFTPGQTTKSFEVSITNDALAEGDELFAVNLSAASPGVQLAQAQAFGRIVANDATPLALPVLRAESPIVDEAAGYIEVVVRLSAPSAQQVSVGYGTAHTNTTGFELGVSQDGTLNFAPGETVRVLRIDIGDDFAFESTEAFYVHWTNPVGVVLEQTYTFGLIQDNDASPGTPLVGIRDVRVDESAGVARFVVWLDKPSSSLVRVNYSTVGDSASAGLDFTAMSGTLAFAPGETLKVVQVPLLDDATAEGVERFSVSLGEPEGATIGQGRGFAFIAPSDIQTVQVPTMSIDSLVVNESQGYADVVIRLSAPSTQQVAAALRDDYYGSLWQEYAYGYATTVVFAPGEVEKTVRYIIHDDTEFEPTQFFRVYLTSPSNAVLGNTYAQVNIASSDGTPGTPFVSIDDTLVDEKAGLAALTITLDRPSQQPVTVSWAAAQGSGNALADSDFRPSSGDVVFAPNETTRTVWVPIVDDTDVEGGELFSVVLGSASGATLAKNEGTVWIAPSDVTAVNTPLVSVVSRFVNEAEGYVDVAVMLNAPSAQQVSVLSRDYYLAASADSTDYSYSTNHTLTFAPGETLKLVRYSLFGDTVAEPDESFYVNLYTPVGLNIGNPYSVVTLARNSDSPGTPAVSVLDAVADEKSGFMLFNVVFDRPSNELVSFNWNTGPLSADSSDFVQRSGVMRVLPGHTQATLLVPINDDSTAEGDELFTLTLSNLSGASAGQVQATGRISASDGNLASLPVISVSHTLADEAFGYVDVLFKLSAPRSDVVSVTWNSDYIGDSWRDYAYNYDGVLVFAPGETSKVVRIAVHDDSTAEPVESFYVQLSSPVNGVMGNSRALVSLVATEAASGTPVMWTQDPVVDEKAGAVVFHFTLDRPATETVSFAWTTQHITTDAGDIADRGGRVAFLPGQLLASVTVALTDDALAEGEEFFRLALSDPQGLTLSHVQAVARIAASDNASATSPVIYVESTTVNELAGYVEAVVRLSAPGTQQISVSYDDTYIASQWEDYSYSNSGSLVFAPGETLKTIRYAIYTDSEAEGAEGLYLRLHTPTNAVIGQPYATVTIAPHNTSVGTPYLRVDDVTVDEKAGSVSFVVSLSEPANSVVSVNYATVDGQANASGVTFTGDFEAVSGQLSFAPGETLKRVSVPLNDDPSSDIEELFYLDLSGASGALIAQARGVARIGASDGTLAATPTVSMESVVVNEAAGVAEMVMRLSRPSSQQASVSFSTTTENTSQSADYGSANSGVVVFAPGETTKVVRWLLLDDALGEGFESFSVRLTSPTGANIGTPYAYVTIAPNDNTAGNAPSASIANVVVDERDGMARFVVTLDSPSTELVTLNWQTDANNAIQGLDYRAMSGTIALWPGETTRTILVPLTDDTEAEGDESFIVTLSSPLNVGIAQAVGTARIVANDAAPVASPQLFVEATSVNEAAGYVDVVVRLSAPSNNQVSVNYSDSYPTGVFADYSYGNSGTLVFPAGSTVRTIRYAIVDDAIVEGNETFTVTLATPVNATLGAASAGVTIHDRDGGPTVSITDNQSGVLTAGGTVVYTLTFSEAVTGLTLDDFNISGVGANASLTGSGASYQLSLSAGTNVQGTQSIALKPDAVQNVGGTGNLAASATQPIDTRPPALLSYSPADEASGVRVGSNVVLEFDEPVSFGSGSLQLLRGATLVESFDVGVASPRLQLSADGRLLTIDPTANLLADSVYTLTFDAGVVRDAVNLPIPALTEGYNFTTAANAPPAGALSIQGNPAVGATLTLQNNITDGDGLGAFSYQWLRNGQPIAGATGTSYLLVVADGGTNISVRASYTDGGGTAESVVSAATSAVVGGTPIVGTGNGEVLPGTAGPDSIDAGGGDDRLVGGLGADTLNGGEGYDIADYRGGSSAINASFVSNTVSQDGSTDTLVNIEVIFGSALADVMLGANGLDNLRGETVRGGAGNDTLNGGSGVDTAEYTGARSGYTVSRDVGSGVITVTDIDLSNGNDGTDVLTNFERVMFAEDMLAFGTRAEELARVAMVLWGPGILASAALFSRGYSFYDTGHSFELMSRVALNFWGHLNDTQLAATLKANSGTSKTEAQLLATLAANGGDLLGRAAMVREAALDPGTTVALDNSQVKVNGIVTAQFVESFGQLFGLWPG